MRWDETVASQCRYGEIAGRIFGDTEVIWERSENDYQGGADVIARAPDGTYRQYAWSYGSCSGCDEWEATKASDDAIEAEMRRATATYTRETLDSWRHMLETKMRPGFYEEDLSRVNALRQELGLPTLAAA